MSKYPYKSTHIDYFQIGAHIGNTVNDPIFSKEMNNKTLILIEPVPFLYDMLKQNYSPRIKSNEIEFLQIAVSDRDGELDLYAPSKQNDLANHPFFLHQMASTTDRYFKIFNFKERFPQFIFEKIGVQSRRFNTLVRERGIESIDTLILDTEGHDFTILMDVDFKLVKPKKIIFENFYMRENPSIGEDGSKYKVLMQYLTDNGYGVIHETDEDTTVINIELR